MIWSGKMILIGIVYLLMLFIPNMIWVKNQPIDYEKYVISENKILQIFERAGEILVCCFVIIVPNFERSFDKAWSIWLYVSFVLMILYEIYWIRYFRSEKRMIDFYSSICGVPVAGATLPVFAFLLLGIYERNVFLIISTIILGIGHIGIHVIHYKETAKSLRIIPAYNFPQEVKTLFAEYTEYLIEGNPAFKDYLALQNYDEEIAHLEVKYGSPYGRLYLAYYEGKLAGCIGLRKIDEENCEMKRMYVREQFRGKHIATELVQKILADAKNIGYKNILLDTLPFLENAIAMYKSYGFVEIESYNDSPMEGLVYLKYSL